MIKVLRVDISEDKQSQILRFSFPLKVSRYVWLTDNKLELEYPIKFTNIINIGEAVAFSLLPAAYIEDSNIEFPPNLSIQKETQENINKICELWNKWFLCDRSVKIFSNITPTSPHLTNQNRYAAQLFSGGVDSMATFKRQRDKVKYLVLYKGADVPINRPDRFEEIRKYFEEFSKEQNKELVCISTNTHFLSRAPWENLGFACSMIGPLLALANYINQIYIASSLSGESQRLIPLGSHPNLDPMISTNDVKTIHDGFDLSRLDKIKLISEEPKLIRKLRVCGRGDIDDKVYIYITAGNVKNVSEQQWFYHY